MNAAIYTSKFNKLVKKNCNLYMDKIECILSLKKAGFKSVNTWFRILVKKGFIVKYDQKYVFTKPVNINDMLNMINELRITKRRYNKTYRDKETSKKIKQYCDFLKSKGFIIVDPSLTISGMSTNYFD